MQYAVNNFVDDIMFHVMEPVGQNQGQHCVSSGMSGGGTRCGTRFKVNCRLVVYACLYNFYINVL